MYDVVPHWKTSSLNIGLSGMIDEVLSLNYNTERMEYLKRGVF